MNSTNHYWGSMVLGWLKHLQEQDLGGTDYKTLFFICEKMNPQDNVAYIKQKNIAEELKMDKGNVSRAIKRLKSKQFIAKRDNGFMVNPHLFYVGKSQRGDREMLRSEFDKLVDDPIFNLNEDEHELEKISNQRRQKRKRRTPRKSNVEEIF